MDAGWTEQIEIAEEMKCEAMRRAFGLIVSNNRDDYDCTCCGLFEKCGM